jgi:hypothetical protein
MDDPKMIPLKMIHLQIADHITRDAEAGLRER